MNFIEAYFYSLCIISFANAIKALENISSSSVFDSKGILDWRVSKTGVRFFITTWRAYFFNFIFKGKNFKVFLWLKFFISLFLFVLSCFKITSPSILFLEFSFLFLFSLRSFYALDGGYYMSLILTGSLFLTAIFGIGSNIAKFCMYFITGQLILSYFIAGITKIISTVWRNGSALQLIFRTEAYGNTFLFNLVKNNKLVKLFLSWSVMLFEVLFPLIVFVDEKFIIYFLIGAFFFHLMNAVFMGLNNFLLVFLASYPVVFYSISSLEFSSIASSMLIYQIIPFLLISYLFSRFFNLKQKINS
jgi:hypothetical protein